MAVDLAYQRAFKARMQALYAANHPETVAAPMPNTTAKTLTLLGICQECYPHTCGCPKAGG